MPNSDWPDPDDVPDMSIPERKPPRPEPPRSRPQRRPEPETSQGWRKGDRVLAPWEPQFLYAGRIARIEGARALIEFDDGDSGWVLVERIRELAIQRDQEVLCRKRMGPFHYPAVVRALRDDQVLVEFAAGGEDEWVTVGALRIPCTEVGPGATPTHIGSHLAFLEHLQRGDRIWAPWQGGALFVGSVDRIGDDKVHVRFDDGDQAWVRKEQIFPLVIPIGLRVMCRKRMGPAYHPGTVTDVDDDRVFIQYDDGGKEWTTPAALALPPANTSTQQQTHPGVQAAGGGFRWQHFLGWIVPIAIGIIMLLVWWSRR
jgi:preprotein translocase subunit YajC